jgi:hypothetical protein
LEKSASTALPANNRFSLLISQRSVDSREFLVDAAPSDKASAGSN